MSTVILDTNIFVRATAIQNDDPESAFLHASKHDRDSSPEATHGALSPRQCRALLCSQLMPPNKVLMPPQQAEELIKVIGHMRQNHQLAPHNEALLRCLEQFIRNAIVGNRVPILAPHLQQQFDVLKEALSIASTIANTGTPDRQRRAQRFIEKNERFLVRVLPEPNIQLLSNCKRPFIWNDWMLCHAAKRSGTVVATIDRDFDILSEAFVRVTGYNPARYLEYYPNAADVGEFRRAFQAEKPKSSTPDVS